MDSAFFLRHTQPWSLGVNFYVFYICISFIYLFIDLFSYMFYQYFDQNTFSVDEYVDEGIKERLG